ncbi:MAG: hypothetical protein Kow00108_04280 [Calditrichia bacterium]
MKHISFFLIIIMLGALFGQQTDSIQQTEKSKYVSVHAQSKPYVEGGYELAENLFLVSGLGFYKSKNDSYFLIKGGLQFFIKNIDVIKLYSGGIFSFEANPGVVGVGNVDSRMRISGIAGGWIPLTKHISLDGQLNLNLDFNHTPVDDFVEFGFITSSIGIVILF